MKSELTEVEQARGIGARWFFYPPEGSATLLPRRVVAVNLLVAFALIGVAVFVPAVLLDVHWDWSSLWRFREKFVAGFKLTILLASASLLCSVLAGLVSALAGRSRFLPLRYVNRIYLDLVRCTPMVVLILFFWYVTSPAIGLTNRNVAGIAILSLAYGAYISEIIRAGVENIGKSQLESAKAIGLTAIQTYRYVIFPQALRQVLPPMAGQLVSLIKDSALLSVISVGEFTKNAMETSDITYSSLECYSTVAVGYLVLTLPITFVSRWLEARSRFET